MKIRLAKIFIGTRKKPEYRTELQYREDSDSIWQTVNEEWATPQDKQRFESAQQNEYINSPR